jgi:glycine oxidase
MTVKRPDVLVVGAGVIGCSVAYALAKRGASVTVLERDTPGGVTSRASAGMLVPTAEGLPSGPLLDLALRSLAMFPSLAAALLEDGGVDVEYSPSGVLLPASTDEVAAELRARAKSGQDGLRWLSRAEALEREPLLEPSLHGALFQPNEGHVHPVRLTDGLTQAAARRGAAFHFGMEVDGLVRQGNRVVGVRTGGTEWHAGAVVLAAGSWSGALARWAGVAVDVLPVRGQVVSLRVVPQPIRSVVFGRPGYLVPRRDGTLLLGASQEWVGFENRSTAGNLAMLLEAGKRLVPVLEHATFLATWSGLRPGSPDEAPILGPAPGLEGLALATGHFRNGILLSAITGELMAEYLLHGKAQPLEPFSVERFSERQDKRKS